MRAWKAGRSGVSQREAARAAISPPAEKPMTPRRVDSHSAACADYGEGLRRRQGRGPMVVESFHAEGGT
jgi:hypothetical protein